MAFVHLHVHSEYSLLDGACRIGSMMDRVQEIGQEAIALTDHGVMYGTIDFYRAAKKAGIKPIVGCEVYVAHLAAGHMPVFDRDDRGIGAFAGKLVDHHFAVAAELCCDRLCDLLQQVQ